VVPERALTYRSPGMKPAPDTVCTSGNAVELLRKLELLLV
jgi:hypothetical protein